MLSPPLHLKAENSDSNVYRWYSLTMGQDLFGEWMLITKWGRIGYKGQLKEYVFPEEKLAQREYQRILRKRLNSHKRIGCRYRIIHL